MGLELQKGESSIELNQTDLQADEQDFKIDQADFSQLKSPAWLEHQPFGQLPYLVDTETGVEIFETRAMIRCEFTAGFLTDIQMLPVESSHPSNLLLTGTWPPTPDTSKLRRTKLPNSWVRRTLWRMR